MEQLDKAKFTEKLTELLEMGKKRKKCAGVSGD